MGPFEAGGGSGGQELPEFCFRNGAQRRQDAEEAEGHRRDQEDGEPMRTIEQVVDVGGRTTRTSVIISIVQRNAAVGPEVARARHLADASALAGPLPLTQP